MHLHAMQRPRTSWLATRVFRKCQDLCTLSLLLTVLRNTRVAPDIQEQREGAGGMHACSVAISSPIACACDCSARMEWLHRQQIESREFDMGALGGQVVPTSGALQRHAQLAAWHAASHQQYSVRHHHPLVYNQQLTHTGTHRGRSYE